MIGNNRFEIHGKGQPILLVHGMGGPKIWLRLIEQLKHHYTLIVPTLPGFLKSDDPFDYSDKLYVDFLCEIRESLNIESWHVAGFSMGGRTAINYSLKETERVSKLILIDSIGVDYMSSFLRIPMLNSLFPFIVQSMLKTEKDRTRMVLQEFIKKEGELADICATWFNELVDSKVVRRNFSNILAKVGVPCNTWSKQLPHLNIPTQILWASDDTTAPLKWGQALNSLIPNSKLKVLDGYKHMAIWEYPDFFEYEIKEFIL